jgi:C-terminal processing protease CtpA/Prc
LLSKVQTEEVLRQNKFIGWRLISFPAEWDGSGIQPGDVITAVAGQPTPSAGDLATVLATQKVGATVEVDLRRNGQEQTVQAELGDLGGP